MEWWKKRRFTYYLPYMYVSYRTYSMHIFHTIKFRINFQSLIHENTLSHIPSLFYFLSFWFLRFFIYFSFFFSCYFSISLTSQHNSAWKLLEGRTLRRGWWSFIIGLSYLLIFFIICLVRSWFCSSYFLFIFIFFSCSSFFYIFIILFFVFSSHFTIDCIWWIFYLLVCCFTTAMTVAVAVVVKRKTCFYGEKIRRKKEKYLLELNIMFI